MEWTDDMSVRLARGESMRSLIGYWQAAESEGVERSGRLTVLTERFALSFDDARLAMDRIQGGFVRAASGVRANEPDPVKDPVAWAAYQIAFGRPFVEEDTGPTPDQVSAAEELLEWARRAEPTKGTTDIAIALEVARQAVSSSEPGRVRYYLLLEAATCISVAAEDLIGQRTEAGCARAGSQLWVDGVMLAGAARRITETYAAQPDPVLEERGYGLVGRIVTGLLGQCHAFVGRAMLDAAHCAERKGDHDGAVRFAEPVLHDFAVLLDWFAEDAPFDEHVVAIRYLREAVELVARSRRTSQQLTSLLSRCDEVLSRASA